MKSVSKGTGNMVNTPCMGTFSEKISSPEFIFKGYETRKGKINVSTPAKVSFNKVFVISSRQHMIRKKKMPRKPIPGRDRHKTGAARQRKSESSNW